MAEWPVPSDLDGADSAFFIEKEQGSLPRLSYLSRITLNRATAWTLHLGPPQPVGRRLGLGLNRFVICVVAR